MKAEENIEQLDLEAIVLEERDPRGALALWERAREIAESAASAEPSARSFHNLGYISYMLWARTGEHFEETERTFLRALYFKPDACLSLFYLGALYFEAKNTLKAQAVFETVREKCQQGFLDIGQCWRYAKSVEMLVATLIDACAQLDLIDELMVKLEASYRALEDPESQIPLTLVGTPERVICADNHQLPTRIFVTAARIVEVTHSTESIRKRFPYFSRAFIN